MAKRRVYEIAKDQGVSSAVLLAALKKAGVEAKVAASSVDEADAINALSSNGDGAGTNRSDATEAPASSAKSADAKSPQTQVRSAVVRERSAGGGGRRRRVVIDSQASRRPITGSQQLQQPRPKRGRRRGRPTPIEEPVATVEVQDAVEKQPEVVDVQSGATVKDVAAALAVQVPDVMKKLMSLGEMATITQTLSDEAIVLIAAEFSKQVRIYSTADESSTEPVHEDSEADLQPRPPVVTIMGHVDHGKTSLLDAIREAGVAEEEAGGITQHIGAYQVPHKGGEITFLDTPGHQAFTAMRARGARVTDVATIVVAADDGVMPQTMEAIDHARAAEVPIVIAVNKIDKEGADPDRVRKELAGHELTPEEWGGETIYCDVSAKTKDGLDNLLDMVQLVTEVSELKANPDAPASGTIIESKLDPGRGPVVTVLVLRGTLRVGDALVAGQYCGKVRAMHDFRGGRIGKATPGMPAEILGLDGVPDAGESVRTAEHERQARQLASDRAKRLRTEELARRRSHVSLEDVFKRIQQGTFKELNLIVKADVAGSLEAIEDEMAKLPQEEIQIRIIHAAVGGINESDVMLASASDAVVIGFNVRPLPEARQAAERERVDVRTYTVIYKAVEEIRAAMEGMLDPEEVQVEIGTVEVRQLFRSSKIGLIAGSMVTSGRVVRGARARLVRDGTIVYEGTVDSLRRLKDDAREVKEGLECGIVLKDFADLKEGDSIEVYETKSVEREL